MNLYNIELLNIEKQANDFPLHYHDSFCITLIKNGTFQTAFQERKCFSEMGTIAISNPYELHANPKISTNNQVSFSTIYIPSDVIIYYFETKDIWFHNKVINDVQLVIKFSILENTLKMKYSNDVENALKSFIQELSKHASKSIKENTKLNFGRFNEINDFIECNIKSKICLTEMAQIANLNKFTFIRSFKQASGMSPSQYVLMKKTFASKANFLDYDNLTEIAYDYNFTDLAHWSNTFKKYIGVAPSDYKKILDL